MSKQRTVLVSGCSEGGAGHALALGFAAQGFRVFATARSTKSLALLQEKDIEILTLDVTQPESISALKTEIIKRTEGKLDVLFNNAGSNATASSENKHKNLFNGNACSPQCPRSAVSERCCGAARHAEDDC
ncbi:hypothetical protein EDB81DRAFT_765793 [Dactylonectria macrodidyma]|uniref:Uncharacterized protein n=1 Tax=Dactylonectria macrodidyma TaxID=307937 RepID=A0A9P9DSV4_9HYPO|nr:hypothetical protein EDB81DRAFT_765793 [Dactylonectria macrodidyma]